MNTPVAGGTGDTTAADGTGQPERDRGELDAGQPVVVGRDRQRRGHRLPGGALPGCRLLQLRRDRPSRPGRRTRTPGSSASTSYSYRVRAVDAAPNLGPYSATATATTPAAADTTAADAHRPT